MGESVGENKGKGMRLTDRFIKNTNKTGRFTDDSAFGFKLHAQRKKDA